MSLPKVIYVQQTDDNDSDENLMAWRNKNNVEEGPTALYVKGDDVDVRVVSEIRRKGTKRWEKW